MHEEWSTSSWKHSRVIVAALVFAVGALIIGVALSRILSGAPVATAAFVGASTEDPEPPITAEPEILDAVSVTRNGSYVPAPTEQITVVQVSVSACDVRSTGSGFLVNDGLILTAAHVVGDAALVRIDHRGAIVTGEVLGVLGDGRDVALVAVDAPLATPLAGSDVPRDGALTLVGHLDGGPRSAVVGPVVDIAPVVATLAGGGEIVGVEASIAEGISGGPAVDAEGNVVGIVVSKEVATDTAIVLALPDLATIGSAGLVPGECPGQA